MRFDDATLAQIEAADPGASTWLSANAGSGKTRVLTDRVARLLLREVPPERILCLTYTKAAASEMQNRLFRRLGEWAMLAEGVLRGALIGLGDGVRERRADPGRADRGGTGEGGGEVRCMLLLGQKEVACESAAPSLPMSSATPAACTLASRAVPV